MADARIPDHCGWAARGRWREAYDAAVSDLAAAHAEIERLTKERDEARAQVAMAFEAAANLPAVCYDNIVDRSEIRALTPADAQAALEAYGREKMREGMRMAAKIADQDSSAYHIRSEIRAAMETLK